jgi:hypothetical protein
MTVYKILKTFINPTQIIYNKRLRELEIHQKSMSEKKTQHDFLEMIGQKQVNMKSTYTLQTFKIIKYSKVVLDYMPKEIEFKDPFIIIIYNS